MQEDQAMQNQPPINNHSHKDGVGMWELTASPTVQQCIRAGCRAVRHLVNGAWREPQKSLPQSVPPTTQTSLWRSR